jgi:hypothetical protein
VAGDVAPNRPIPSPDPDPPAAGWISGALGICATWIPFAAAVSRAASAGQWRDDLPAVRDLGLVAVGFGGGVSTVVTQAFGLVPLGPRTFRAALGSAVALAVAARLLYGLVRGALDGAGDGSGRSPAPRLDAAIAAIATLTAALSPTLQREATVGGGAMIATALSLAALTLGLRASEAGPRTWIGLGALLGAALAESPPAALAIAVTTAAMVASRCLGASGGLGGSRARRGALPRVDAGRPLRLPPDRVLAIAVAFGLGITALLTAPLLLRPHAPRAWVDLGSSLSAATLSALDTAGARTTAIAAWVREISLVSLGIAAFGAGVGVLRPRLRPVLAACLSLVALDTILPAQVAGVLSADPLTALRALAVAAIALASALGVREVVARVLGARFPMARAAAVLVVVFHLTLVALASEEAGFATDRSEQLAAEVWADEALGGLLPRSAVLVKSPAIAWRLWAARLTRGERPDVLIIPIPLLDHGRVAASLIAADRAVEPLLRDFALSGQPGEFSLSHLADARALHVELDPVWSKRLVGHLRIDGLWLEYAPQPLGPSDRRQSSAAAAAPMRRVLAAITGAVVPEAPTAAVVTATLRAHASALNALGERDAADLVLARIADLLTRDPTVAEVRLPYAVKGMRRALLKRYPGRAR